MKLFDIILGKKKKTQYVEQTSPTTSVRHPATRKPNSTVQGNSLPQKHPDANRSTRRPPESYALEQFAFQGLTCKDNSHDFARPYPFTCRKCGLVYGGNTEEIIKYMGSFFDDTCYQWNVNMQKTDIVSFSLSTGNRPVFEANCNFSVLTVRCCLNGSRDGWMQPQYPADYFEPKAVKLENADVSKIKEYINKCNFSAWITPEHYAENQIMGACGFHVEKTFTCRFANGRKFTCLKPDNPEFKQLVSLIREMAEKNAKEEDQAFIKRMLQDTEKKEKQIYWLVSQSMEEKWMDLIARGIPFFNYRVASDMRNGENANAELMVNVIRFSDGAAWVTENPVPEAKYQWNSLPAGRRNDLGSAFSLLTQHFENLPEPTRQLFPIVAAVLDGPITDDWLDAQARFLSLPGVNKNVLLIALIMGAKVEKGFLKTFEGVAYQINSMEDIISELDSPLFSL